jgi:hypothetical protein
MLHTLHSLIGLTGLTEYGTHRIPHHENFERTEHTRLQSKHKSEAKIIIIPLFIFLLVIGL